MNSYEYTLTGTDNVRKGGATNGGDSGQPGNPGGPGATAVVGKVTPIVVEPGATNNG